jgi:hypothetical protein
LYSSEKGDKKYDITIRPDLKESEIKFIADLKKYLSSPDKISQLGGYTVYVVRNQPGK